MSYHYPKILKYFVTLLSLVMLVSSPVEAGGSEKGMKHKTSGIVAVFAHPDDETWISGTVALLASIGVPLNVIYATSGDAGQDVSGEGRSGEELAREREKEATRALIALGVQEPPVFLQLPDLKLQVPEIQAQLLTLLENQFKALKPDIVLTFGEDGITGHTDHKAVGIAVRRAADISDTTSVVLNIAISEPRAKALNEYAASMGIDLPSIYPTYPVAPAAVDLTIDVESFADQRIEAFAQHKTQFPPLFNDLWQLFVSQQSREEVIVSRLHNRKPKLFYRILRDKNIAHNK